MFKSSVCLYGHSPCDIYILFVYEKVLNSDNTTYIIHTRPNTIYNNPQYNATPPKQAVPPVVYPYV